ncbi:MAG: GNAT family N-acetyltransferase [Bacteroidota bacterium]
METIRSLKDLSLQELYLAFQEAFEGYSIQLSEPGFLTMMKRRGLDRALSFAAFSGDRPVSFTLNGTGFYDGYPTAYDTGTGTVKEYRGKGLATAVFNFSRPFLVEAGIAQYLLEVLQDNEKAVSVYSKIGFAATREFYYYIAAVSDIHPEKPCDPSVEFREASLEEVEEGGSFFDFEPSWQNSFESVRRNLPGFRITAAFNPGLVGFCITEPASGDLSLLAVKQGFRNRGIGSGLLRRALEQSRCGSVKVINTEVGSEAIYSFLESTGFRVSGRQYEMKMKL